MHGNRAALDAVLGDADRCGAERFVLGGDYALFGPHPEDTVERLRELDAVWIRGNVDRWTHSPGDAPGDAVVQAAIEACAEALGARVVAELAALPETRADGETLYCHASPRSDVESFLPEPRAEEAELLEGVEARRLVFGHTHLPFAREAGGIELVNPGSVGMPFDGDPRAAYAVVADDGTVEHRRVAYDHAAAAADVRARFAEWGETAGRRIETARFVG